MLLRNTILFAFVALVSASGDSVGCYSSVDTSVSKGTYQYQTPLYCAQQCSSYPYVALRGGNACYCLESIPSGSTANTCSTICQGFGSTVCGGDSSFSVYTGLGTASSSQLSNSASSPSSSTASPKSSTTAKLTATSSSDTDSTPATSSTDDTTLATETSSQGSTATPVHTVVTSTELGGNLVVYKTVTSLPSSTSSLSSSLSSSSASSSPKKKSSNVGPIVGGVVGGIAGLALLCVGVFLFLRYRRDDDEDDEEEYFDKPAGVAPAPLGRGNTAKGSRRNKPSPLDMPMSNPFVHPLDATASLMSGTLGGTGGLLLSNTAALGLVDPRLNPIMMGRRRLSEGLLADEADYSRKILQVANPE